MSNLRVVTFLKCVVCGKVKKQREWIYLTNLDFLKLRGQGYLWDYQFVECPDHKKEGGK